MKRVVPVALSFVVIVAAVAAGYALSGLGGGQRLSASLPNAIGLEVGTPVQLKGFDVGKVITLQARGDKAFVEMSVDDLPEPLHAGTTARVKWSSVLGHRLVELVPGPAQNPVLGNPAVIEAGDHQVLVEELLETLDPPTRAHVQSTVKQLDATLQGSQPDFNRTLEEAGPSVQALGAVLNAVGSDGESVKTLLTNLRKVTAVLAARKSGVSSSVLDLNRLTSAAAVHEQAVSDALKELPGTLDAAKVTLDQVPPAANATIPLLDDLRPAAERLPRVSHNLKHVMADLRPALHDLPPVLRDAHEVLRRGPRFFDLANDTLSQLSTTVRPEYAGNAVRYVRPYTPEVMGFIGNWGNAFAGYDSSGGYVGALVTGSETGLNDSPDIVAPGYWPERIMPPGINGDQPWKDANSWDDANGSAPR